MRKIYFLTAIFMFLSVHQCFSQNISKNSDCSKFPCWIEMMNDTNANYFETVKAFDTFWDGKKIPKGENEEIGEDIDPSAKKSNRNSNRKSRKEKEPSAESYRFQVKKYYHWQQEVLPYVQEDGHILTPSERLKIWNTKNEKR